MFANLAINHDSPEPAQRAVGEGKLVVTRRDDESHISRMRQSGCAKIRVPQSPGRGLHAIMINSSGGMTGGDQLKWHMEVGEEATATFTTQACERIYKAPADTARVDVDLRVTKGGKLAWLPQETILFDRGSLTRNMHAELAAQSEALFIEPLIFGRQAMGECVACGYLQDRWRIFQDGHLLHGEDLLISDAVEDKINRQFNLGPNRSMVTVLLVSPAAEGHLTSARQIISDSGGVSAWNGKLLARLVAHEGYDLRQKLVPLIKLLNFEAEVPKMWSL